MMDMLERLISAIFKRSDHLHRHAGRNALRHYEQAVASRAQGELDEAEAHYRSAIESDPVAPELCYNLGLLFQEVGDISKAEEFFRRVHDRHPDYQPAQSSFLCLGDFSMFMTRDEIYSRHIRWAQKFADPLKNSELQRCNSKKHGSRLKVGYVSADFRRHAVGRFLEPVLHHHDSSRYEVVCYNNAESGDDMTDHMRTLVDHWRNIFFISDLELATLVHGDQVDILIDLSGHTLGNRLLTFARKPAPVQISWLGYLNTTGMQAMDFRLTDVVSDPPGTERWYREQLLRLPGPQWCYAPEAGPIVAPVSLAMHRRNNDPVVFACMTRFMKITDSAVDLWIQILQALPDTSLRIVDVPVHYRARELQRRFDNAGLGGRVEMVPTLFGKDYWQAFDEIDVALDTFPYTGATTTCDCLWMGVPVVTLAGPCGAARSASSLLVALGLHEMVAITADDYVAIAIRLGQDRIRLAALRASLRDRMKESTICDPISFTRNFEHQLEIAWTGLREKRSSNG